MTREEQKEEETDWAHFFLSWFFSLSFFGGEVV